MAREASTSTDDAGLHIDQVVVSVGEERGALHRTGPLGGRIGRRDELRRDLCRGAEGRIVECRQILLHGVARRGGIALFAPLGTGYRPALVGVGLDKARIDGKALAADEPGGDARQYDTLEDVAQHVAIAEAPMPVLRERRVVGHLVVKV